MHAICINCANAPLLKSLVSKSSLSGKCSICQSKSKQILRTSEDIFVKAIKALIRYHYSEWAYHSTLGGDSIERLLMLENPIFKSRVDIDPLDFEEFLLSFRDRLFDEKDISLITAYSRDIFNYIPYVEISSGDHPLLNLI